MSRELTEKRQRWYDNIQPGALVRFDYWASGYTNKPALIVSIEGKHINADRRRPGRKYYTILVDEHKRLVYQDFISPWDGWSSLVE